MRGQETAGTLGLPGARREQRLAGPAPPHFKLARGRGGLQGWSLATGPH